MTEQETWKIIYVLKASYMNQFKGYTTADFENLVKVWGMMFEDYTYEEVSTGLKIFLASDTKGFAPSPGQIIDCISKLKEPQQMTVGEAWSMVRKAIERGTYHSEEDFDSFPELIKKAVGSAANIRSMATNEDYNEDVERSLFERSYNNVLSRDREYQKLPSKVKALLQNTVNQLEMKGKSNE